MPTPVDPSDVTDPYELYSLPLDEFIGARDRLAARLSAGGRADEAALVARLRKPSVVAWALNRAAHSRPEAVEALLEAHRSLREATSAELLREASDERRRAVADLEAAALAELTADGRPASGATRSGINNTLLAVATDPEGEADLVAGRLAREIELSGAGWGDVAIAPPPETSPSQLAADEARRSRARADKLRGQAEQAEQGLALAEQALSRAKRRAQEARAVADRASEEAEAAEKAAGLPPPS